MKTHIEKKIKFCTKFGRYQSKKSKDNTRNNDQQFAIDLCPCDLKFRRDVLLSKATTILRSSKGTKDIEWSSVGTKIWSPNQYQTFTTLFIPFLSLGKSQLICTSPWCRSQNWLRIARWLALPMHILSTTCLSSDNSSWVAIVTWSSAIFQIFLKDRTTMLIMNRLIYISIPQWKRKKPIYCYMYLKRRNRPSSIIIGAKPD